MPFEFKTLGVPFEPWQPEDTAVIAKFMELRFLKGWTTEITKDFISTVFEESFVEVAYPAVGQYSADDDSGVIITDDELKEMGLFVDQQPCPECDTQRKPDLSWYDDYLNPENDFSDFDEEFELAAISNNWVIGPNKTSSGKPILANDPHLPN